MRTKKWQRRLLRVLASLIVVLLLLRFFVFGSIDTTPYFETDYYRQTIQKMDAGIQAMAQGQGPILAGFSKASITPIIVAGAPDVDKGEFNAIKMAGFGNGQIAKGVHDSIFAKAIAIQVGEKELVLVSSDLV